jgi:hypothetical protein
MGRDDVALAEEARSSISTLCATGNLWHEKKAASKMAAFSFFCNVILLDPVGFLAEFQTKCLD